MNKQTVTTKGHDTMKSAGSRLKRIRRSIFAQTIRWIALAKSRTAHQRNARKHCQVFKNIAYLSNGDFSRQLDIYRPEHFLSPRPVIIYIHGGGFSMCSKETHQGVALAYADKGYLVFNINYRRAPRHRYPAAMEDVAWAWQWVIENVTRYGGDPDQITVAGESAGGNLTLALAAACCFPMNEPVAKRIHTTGVVPKNIMVLCGMLQVSQPDHLKKVCPPINPFSRKLNLAIARDVSFSYLGSAGRQPHADRMLADPLLIMESEAVANRLFPAIYAMAGTHDILLDHTRRLEKTLIKRKIQHTVRYYTGQGHAFHLLGFSRQAAIFWKDNFAFLERI